MRFTKGHGTENDFVIIADLQAQLDISPELVRAICDRRAGIGADGILRVVPTLAMPGFQDQRATYFMDYRNSDGSVAEMCGNGARVFARWLVDKGLEGEGSFAIGTRGGARAVNYESPERITVSMGVPTTPSIANPTIQANGSTWQARALHIPNPHAVLWVDDLAEAGDLKASPTWSPDEAFPEAVNVEFLVRKGPRHVAMRVFERGSGETRSCGTGACAAGVVALWDEGVPEDPATAETIHVDVPGGTLEIRLNPGGGVDLIGPAEIVAEGEIAQSVIHSAGGALPSVAAP